MNIKAIFCDLDDTLIGTRSLYDSGAELCRTKFNAKLGFNYSKENFLELYNEAQAEIKKSIPTSPSSHNRLLFFQRMLENLDLNIDFSLVSELNEIYLSYIYSNVRLYTGAMEFIDKIKKEGRKFAIVSDGLTGIKMKKLSILGLDGKVDCFVTSEEAGVEKPDPKIFQLALEKSGVEKNEVLYLGNNSRRDIYGAKTFGFKTVWANIDKIPGDEPKSDDEKADYEINSLQEVDEIIFKLESN